VPVFLSVVDEEKNPRGGEALDQAIEERLGLGVIQCRSSKTMHSGWT